MTIVMAVLMMAGLVAIVSWLRLRYYMRRSQNAIQQELALQRDLNAVRSEGERLFWEGSL